MSSGLVTIFNVTVHKWTRCSSSVPSRASNCSLDQELSLCNQEGLDHQSEWLMSSPNVIPRSRPGCPFREHDAIVLPEVPFASWTRG